MCALISFHHAPLLRKLTRNYFHVSICILMVLLSLLIKVCSCFYVHSSLLLVFYVPQDQIAATPLLVACLNNHSQVAGYLINKGARVNYQNKVIHYLFSISNYILAKLLSIEQWLLPPSCCL